MSSVWFCGRNKLEVGLLTRLLFCLHTHNETTYPTDGFMLFYVLCLIGGRPFHLYLMIKDKTVNFMHVDRGER